jgi:hypothetical protein
MERRVNVDGVRRLLNGSPADMSDDDIRLALVRMAGAADAALTVEDVAGRVRRFAVAMGRLERPIDGGRPGACAG